MMISFYKNTIIRGKFILLEFKVEKRHTIYTGGNTHVYVYPL